MVPLVFKPGHRLLGINSNFFESTNKIRQLIEMEMEMELVRRKHRRLGHCCKNNGRLVELPTEILYDILLRLPISSIFCLRCVSKTSKNRVDCPNVTLTISKHAIVSEIRSTSLNVNYSLSFVFYNLFFFVDFSHRYPECKRMNRSPCFLFNPLKGEVLPLPTTDIVIPERPRTFFHFKEWFAMGFDDATNTYKIVRVFQHLYSLTFKVRAQVYVLGTSSWREIPSIPPCRLGKTNHAAFANGDQHWLVCLPDGPIHIYGGKFGICSFDFKKEEFYWTLTPPEHMQKYVWPIGVPDHLYLLTLKGCLAIVDTSSNDYIEIWVLHDSDKEWKLEWKIDAPLLGRKLINVSCCEWEHGIFFNRQECYRYFGLTVFLNFRSGTVNCVKSCPPETIDEVTSIVSVTGTLISLKNYGHLVEPEPTTGIIRSLRHYDSQSLSNAAASGKDFFYLTSSARGLYG
ncbi:unnamed protein product [Malus baccata var. baccata]